MQTQFKVFLFITSSTAYIIVWAVLCIAFIRFRSWQVVNESNLPPPSLSILPSNTVRHVLTHLIRTNWCALGLRSLDDPLDADFTTVSNGVAQPAPQRRNNYSKYISKGPETTYSTHIKSLLGQPWAAYIGLAGCVLLIVIPSSIWWEDVSEISTIWSVSVYFTVCPQCFFFVSFPEILNFLFTFTL